MLYIRPDRAGSKGARMRSSPVSAYQAPTAYASPRSDRDLDIFHNVRKPAKPTLRLPVKAGAGPPFVLLFRPHNEGGGAPRRR
jgi:hypothetical protein